jgi:hypothetical protein
MRRIASRRKQDETALLLDMLEAVAESVAVVVQRSPLSHDAGNRMVSKLPSTGAQLPSLPTIPSIFVTWQDDFICKCSHREERDKLPSGDDSIRHEYAGKQ